MDEYTPDFRVTPEDLKHDKIEIALNGWQLDGGMNETQQFLISLSDREHDYGRIFNRCSGQMGNRRRTVDIRNSSRDGIPKPLFSGKLIATRQHYDEANDFLRTSLSLELSLNPTRFVKYQELPDDLSFDHQNWPEPDLFSDTLPPYRGVRQRNRERSIDPNDNVLIGPSEEFAAGQNWMRHVERYLRAVADCVEESMNQAAEQEGLSLHHMDGFQYKLKSTETYVEFEPPNATYPVEFVYRTERAISSYLRSTNTRDYEFETSCNGSDERFSRYIRGKLDRGRWIAVYAKTSRRVRVELGHNLKDCSTLLHRDRSRAIQTENLSTLVHWLNRVRVDAANRLNHFFEHIQSIMDYQGYNQPAYQLVARIVSLCGASVSTIYPALVRNSSISLNHGTDAMRNSVRRLVDAGVLETSGTGRRYVYTVTPQYRAALEALSRAEHEQ